MNSSAQPRKSTRFERVVNRAVATASLLAAIVVLTYGPLLFGAQVYAYLRYGKWVAVPAIEVLEPKPTVRIMPTHYGPVAISEGDPEGYSLNGALAFNSVHSWVPSFASLDPGWLRSPQSWIGLHKLIRGTLEDLSAPVFAVLLGFCLLWVAFEAYESVHSS